MVFCRLRASLASEIFEIIFLLLFSLGIISLFFYTLLSPAVFFSYFCNFSTPFSLISDYVVSGVNLTNFIYFIWP